MKRKAADLLYLGSPRTTVENLLGTRFRARVVEEILDLLQGERVQWFEEGWSKFSRQPLSRMRWEWSFEVQFDPHAPDAQLMFGIQDPPQGRFGIAGKRQIAYVIDGWGNHALSSDEYPDSDGGDHFYEEIPADIRRWHASMRVDLNTRSVQFAVKTTEKGWMTEWMSLERDISKCHAFIWKTDHVVVS